MALRTKALIGAGLIVALGGLTLIEVTRLRVSNNPSPRVTRQKPLSPAAKTLDNADALYARHDYGGAEKGYSALVDKWKLSTDKRVQDEVGIARIRLGYLHAKNKDFAKARQAFHTAAKLYRGTGRFNPDFGGIPDAADYQAAVCLSAEGNRQGAEQAFANFIRDWPLSPLVYAAHKRLAGLCGGMTNVKYDQLLQVAVLRQEARAKREQRICGPKALARLLELEDKAGHSLDDLIKLCGTDDKGTSLAGMQKALSSCGLGAFGYRLRGKDFRTMPLPALWLKENHYLVIESIKAGTVYAYDSRLGDTTPTQVPISEPSFEAVVLTLSPMHLG